SAVTRQVDKQGLIPLFREQLRHSREAPGAVPGTVDENKRGLTLVVRRVATAAGCDGGARQGRRCVSDEVSSFHACLLCSKDFVAVDQLRSAPARRLATMSASRTLMSSIASFQFTRCPCPL